MIVTSNQIIGPDAAQDDIRFEWLYEWADDQKAMSTSIVSVNVLSEEDVESVVSVACSNVQHLSETRPRSIEAIDDHMVLPAASVAAAE